ncbi:hypothetical protein [Mangrovihabitans endophyticus]|uniref:Uncharacterized protein n=1 Tax=Mangrovihabitans endophyticus TaxID=1751298 RepID=A0A8J3BWG1_9ACTN|nr:hypothetical protein [Mangrovihabitans endophyticus]GGK84319.1 hypothetical protein GCM10012284_18160 [Mangrovihabitans endophyticus]
MTAVDEAPTRSMSQIVTDSVATFRVQVPECITAALVDMSTGMLLAVDTLEERPDDDLDLLAAATFDLLQGRNVRIIEDVFRGGAAGDRPYFQEMLVNTDDLVHLFLRSARHPDLVAAVACRRQANIGMLFAQARMVMKQMDADFGA